MTIYLWSTLLNSASIAFDPAADTLNFDTPALSASSVGFDSMRPGASVFTAGGKTATLQTSAATLTTANVVFNDGSILAIGDNTIATANDGLANALTGTAGNDQLVGLGGDDALDGGPGADYLAGGSGNDTYIVSETGDVVIETGSIVRASVSADGVEANGNTSFLKLSGDGNHVAFISSASNLVPGDTNGFADVFVKDLITGAIARANTTANGGSASTDTVSFYHPALSADGRYVAFYSEAPNLVPGDTNSSGDVFVKDLLTGAIVRASTAADGSQANLGAAGDVDISANGQYVLFTSGASNLVAEPTSYATGIYVKDLLTGAIVRANTYVDPDPGLTIFEPPRATLSGNGRYVSFVTFASLLPDDTNELVDDLYVRDLRNGGLVRASTASDGSQSGPSGGNVSTFLSHNDISDDGRWVVFTSNASGLVPGNMAFRSDVFIKDLQTGMLKRVTELNDGTPANEFSGDSAISGDGRFVVFVSQATNLVATDTNDSFDVFIRDMQTGDIKRVNVAADGTQTRGFGSDASLSADGQVVAFYHPDANLVSGDTNGESDVFVVRWGVSDLHDTIQTSLPSFTLPQGVEDMRLAAGAVSATGNAFGNLIAGNELNNVLDGREGNDILFGAGGDDSLSGGADDDMIMGESGVASSLGGNDVLRGEGGNDMLDGGAGVDVIYGGEGNDLIHGDEGSDCVMPGAGEDFMLGSAASAYGPATAGGDLFVYTQLADAGDRIWGFDLTPAIGDNDGIDLRPLFDALGYAGINPRSDGFLRVMLSNDATDALVQIDADGAATGQGYITLLTLVGVNAATLTDNYFLFQ